MAETGVASDAEGFPRRPTRADARRNYDKLLAAAADAFERHGAEASLEEIARRAGVGIGTLYRHFPTRQALLAAAYVSEVESLVAHGREWLQTLPPETALARWLGEFVAYARRKRGMAAALKSTVGAESEIFGYCHRQIDEVGTALLRAAAATGAVRADVDLWDVLRAVSGICMVSQDAPDPGQGDRMLQLVLDGLRFQPTTTP